MRHDDKEAIADLANKLANQPKALKIQSVVEFMIAGLMAPPLSISFLKLIFTENFFRKRMVITLLQLPDVADNLWLQAITHLKHGNDKTTDKSVGGFNQEELNKFLTIIKQFGFKD